MIYKGLKAGIGSTLDLDFALSSLRLRSNNNIYTNNNNPSPGSHYILPPMRKYLLRILYKESSQPRLPLHRAHFQTRQGQQGARKGR